MDDTHLLKHMKQAILVWSFRQNTFLGSLHQKWLIWSCYSIALRRSRAESHATSLYEDWGVNKMYPWSNWMTVRVTRRWTDTKQDHTFISYRCITICITYFGYQVSSKDFVTGCCVLMSLMKVMMTMKMMMKVTRGGVRRAARSGSPAGPGRWSPRRTGCRCRAGTWRGFVGADKRGRYIQYTWETLHV